MSELLLSFLMWIAAQSGLAAPPPPAVLFVSPDEMAQRSLRSYNVHALYDRASATVYLPLRWNSQNLYDRAMLLHELVHHAQEFNGVPSRCNAARESQAYDLTRKWLSEQGVADPYGFLRIDELTVAILSSCPDIDAMM